MHSLTTRLVAASVALVALAILAFGAATTLALRSYLMRQLDRDVMDSLALASLHHMHPMNPRHGRAGPPDFVRGQGIGTLTAILPKNGDAAGEILAARRRAAPEDAPLPPDALDRIRDLPADGQPRSVTLPGAGTYRAAAIDLGPAHLVTGLPQAQVDDVVRSVVRWEAGLGLLSLGAAAVIGILLVRRQLAPLHEVAATAHAVAQLPLSSGTVDLAPRVQDPDERTEVGQVGAALNTLLAHVETSLQARHRSEQQVRQFVADASHELRTPLSTIRGYADLATARDDPAVMSESMEKVAAESRRMSALVDDLLLLARLDAGRALESEPVDLTQIVVEAVSDARMLAPGHTWMLNLADAPVEVTGDERRLHQVVANLLTNARLHTPAGTTVTVSVAPGRLTVADDGPGFVDPEHALERFSQGDPTRAARDDGAGLGLAIVDSIVRAHGGRVEIASSPGATAVIVHLP